MRQEEEGWKSAGDKCACAKCFSEDAISNFIKANATENTCSYCGEESDEPIAAEMDEVLAFMAQGIWREYDMPENCLPYESAEGGWQLVEPTDSYDLVADSDWIADSDGYKELFDDLVRAFSNNSYVPRDPLALSVSDGLKYSWGAFCNTVKHETRFVLFKIAPKRRKQVAYHPDDEWESAPVYAILQRIGSLVHEHSLIKGVPRLTTMIRARQHADTDSPSTASELGSPPPEFASQSRMSPAGISMFYGAANEKTAFIETYDAHSLAKNSVTFGLFVTARKLRFLDLTAIPDLPSIFDEHRFHQRHGLIFLRHLRSDMAKPINRDGREHYEYVPTQIVAEYFRRVFKTKGKGAIDGIMFPSSRNGAGVCYCIFSTPQNCADDFRDKKAPVFSFDKKRRMLVLKSARKMTVAACQATFLNPLNLDELFPGGA